MKNFVLAAFCITIVSAQYHGSRGYSSGGGYGGKQQSSSGGMSGGYQTSRGGMSGGYQSSSGGMSGGYQSSNGGMSGGYQSSSGGMSGGYQSSNGGMSGAHHRSGRSLVSQGYSVVGAGHVAAGPTIVNSGSYGHSGHRMGRSVGGDMTSIGPVPVPAVYVNAGHAGHRRGRSVSLLPVVGHSGLGQVAGHASYSGLALTTGHYGSVAGSPVGAYGGAVVGHGGYSNVGHQRVSMGVLHG